MRRRRRFSLLERSLLTVAVLCLGYCAFYWGRAQLAQYWGAQDLEQFQADRSTVQKHGKGTRPTLPMGTLVGRIEIPRLGVSDVVFEGTDETVLSRGVGHLEQTNYPGQGGNVVFAGHRDTFFRPLRNIRVRDQILVTTARGTHRYTVDSTEVVNPEQTEVLFPTPTSVLTLVTCYPFRFFGHAPKRFIVRCHEVLSS